MVVAEVRLCGLLDPVGAVAEIDLVEVLGEDLVLVPVALELVCERSLAELLEDGPALLGAQGVLDELLSDGGCALRRTRLENVLDDCAPDALEVDAAVLVEALILDRDRRLL